MSGANATAQVGLDGCTPSESVVPPSLEPPGTSDLEEEDWAPPWYQRMKAWWGAREAYRNEKLSKLRAELSAQMSTLERTLAERRRAFFASKQECERLVRQREVLLDERDDLDRTIDEAVAAGRDELARSAVRRSMELREQLEDVNQRMRSSEQRQQDLEATLNARERMLDRLRAECEGVLSSRRELADDRDSERSREEAVEAELLRRKRSLVSSPHEETARAASTNDDKPTRAASTNGDEPARAASTNDEDAASTATANDEEKMS